MITRNSRYTKDDTYSSTDPERAQHPIVGVQPRKSADLTVRREHRVIAGERLDQLAYRYYGDPLLFWLICDANDVIFPEDLMIPGKVLRIPRNRM